MAEESFQERTEQATPQRRREAREKGNVAKSQEINSAAVLLIGLLALKMFGDTMYFSMTGLMETVFSQLSDIEIVLANVPAMALAGVKFMGMLILPFAGVIMIAGVGANVLQTGFLLTAEPMKPTFDKISIGKGLKRIVSMRSFVEMIKGILKLLIVGLTAYLTIKGELLTFPRLVDADLHQIVAFIFIIGYKIGIRAAIVILILAAFDFAYQKFEHSKKLKMTKQEIKEEYKRTEGDPLIKARIRSMQRERARSRMLQEVPKADVVITNPTHLAVALKYDREKGSAPVVVAKGARLIAEKIKEIAADNQVPVIENKPVARMLFKAVAIGDMIPYELYQAVAEILAVVYKMKGKNN